MTAPSAQDWFGHAIALQFAITELRNELLVDVIQEHPRLVMLGIAGLKSMADELILAMKRDMEKPNVDPD